MTRALIFLAALLLLALADTAFGVPPKPKAKGAKLASAGWAPPARPEPSLRSLSVNGTVLWRNGQAAAARLKVGDIVTLSGAALGHGPEGDYSKLLIGGVRALERDLPVFEGGVHLLTSIFFETSKLTDSWRKDILSWSDSEIVFRVPVTASRGPLVVYLQDRVGAVESAIRPGTPHLVADPLTERAEGVKASQFPVSRLGTAVESNPVPVEIDNPAFEEEARGGEAAFWTFDFNTGLEQSRRGLDWRTVLRGKAKDPISGDTVDPAKWIGAVAARRGEVPDVALTAHDFDPYPAPMPLKPLVLGPLLSGRTTPTGWVGYVYAEGIPVVSQRKGNWIGFNCAACHSQRIVFEERPGMFKAKVFPGLPNVRWSMKANLLGAMKGMKGNLGAVSYDKSRLVRAVPEGAEDATLVREAQPGDPLADDSFFSPAVIPALTRVTPLRRVLGRTEAIGGFEGASLHAEESSGGIGALSGQAARRLTAYLSTLDGDDWLLQRIALYRQLKRSKALADIDGIGEGQFIQTGQEAFPKLLNRLERGRAAFQRDCLSCHQSNSGTYTDEDLVPLSEVGSYFSPTARQRKLQGIRTAPLRNLFWVTGRGLLHDGHVKSLEDLVSPDRCDEKSDLYRKYYTLHSGTFRIPKGDAAQEAALRRQNYFTELPGDDKHLYWDYQTMRREFGPKELGSSAPVALPAAPHPWCVASASDGADLALYLSTL